MKSVKLFSNRWTCLTISFIILSLLDLSTGFAQHNSVFTIREIFSKDSAYDKYVKEFKKQNIPFFEDSNYLVRKSCHGEFGGTIYFKNKKSDIEYSCRATCPVIVNNFEGKYIVTATLSHMLGFSEIIEIGNPDSMTVLKLPKAKKKGEIIIMSGYGESMDEKGSNHLLDSVGVYTLVSFAYQNQLYHIYTDFKMTYLAIIQNGEFVNIDTVSERNLWTYKPEPMTISDGHIIEFFGNEESQGYLDINNNIITVNRYR